MATEKKSFQAEVSRLLDIVAHSLYSQKEIFLRELISNASDACDRLRYLALTEPKLLGEDAAFRVTLRPDTERHTLEVADNGIGMSRDELIDNLGTIARSGTAQFLQQLSGDERKDRTLIGQFGVGFYSAFMVAEEVEVVTRKAGEDAAWRWVSDGKGEYTIEPAERAARGTTILLRLREDAREFTEAERLRDVVKRYSDHIALPIVLLSEGKEELLNAASALWMRPRSEISADQYREFYHHVGHAGDEPSLTLHWKAEGTIEYAGLLFVPSTKPFDLFDPLRKHRVKLYVRRVFITDDCQELLPSWLRFVRGVIDSEDLPLNVSNPMLRRIRGQVVKRVLTELQKKAKESPEDYATFWENFGAVLKEGLYEEPGEREALLGLARFRSTAGDGLVSLEEYVGRMKAGQEAIYTISGDSLELLRKSPQLEGFRARGVEVLLLTDPIDDFWVPTVGLFKEKPFKSATRAGADLTKIAPAEEGEKPAPAEKADAKSASLVALIKLTLGAEVKDVRLSERLTDSAVCLVADEGDLDMHFERMLRQHQRKTEMAKRILEVNPKHPLIAGLAGQVGKEGAATMIADVAWVLLDQARILEGEPLPDPAAFARRLSTLLEKGLAGPA